jgi:hypothetical protein
VESYWQGSKQLNSVRIFDYALLLHLIDKPFDMLMAGNGLVEIGDSGVYNRLFMRVLVSVPAVLLRKSEAAEEP